LNDNPINSKIYKKIHQRLRPDDIDFIKSGLILHRTYNHPNGTHFITKSLEFECAEINEVQFQGFIKTMQLCGFMQRSKINKPVKNTIQYLFVKDSTVIFNYNFQRIEPTPYKPQPKSNKRSSYARQSLF